MMGLVPKTRKSASGGRSEDREFAVLARRMGLGRSGSGVVRTLASSSGAPAVALLVSEHAFLVGLAERERAATLGGVSLTEADRREIAWVRHQLFGER